MCTYFHYLYNPTRFRIRWNNHNQYITKISMNLGSKHYQASISVTNSMVHDYACSHWNIERVHHAFHRNTTMQIWQFQGLITYSPAITSQERGIERTVTKSLTSLQKQKKHILHHKIRNIFTILRLQMNLEWENHKQIIFNSFDSFAFIVFS